MNENNGVAAVPPADNVSVTRRHVFGDGGKTLLGWAALSCLPSELISGAQAQTVARPVPAEGSVVVTLLGTGSPIPIPDRFGPSTLVEAGGRRLLFDAGRGAPIRLSQIGVRLGDVDAVFLTHYHSDHVNGLPDVWMTSYVPVSFGERSKPMRLWGAVGVSRLAENLVRAFSDDIRIRMADEHVTSAATRIEHHEFAADGVVFDEDGLKVTAFEVDHGPLVKPAYGYRIDHAGRSVLISGDTRYNENVIRHGQGVDLLVHEVCAVPVGLLSNVNIQAVINHHTPPEDAGRLFSIAKPKLAAFTHLALLGTPQFPALSSADVERLTRQTYTGPLVLGEDLTRFTVADAVSTQRWDMVRGGY